MSLASISHVPPEQRVAPLERADYGGDAAVQQRLVLAQLRREAVADINRRTLLDARQAPPPPSAVLPSGWSWRLRLLDPDPRQLQLRGGHLVVFYALPYMPRRTEKCAVRLGWAGQSVQSLQAVRGG